jgi:hypothetical protein
MVPSNPPNISVVVADSDTFKGTPAEGVTTISTGHEGSAGDLSQRKFGSISIMEQNKLAADSTTPPQLRTPESAQAARAGLASPPAPAAAEVPATDDEAPAPTPSASTASRRSSTNF